jgi:hypothetical protein
MLCIGPLEPFQPPNGFLVIPPQSCVCQDVSATFAGSAQESGVERGAVEVPARCVRAEEEVIRVVVH